MLVYLVDDHKLFRGGLKFLLGDLCEKLQFVEADNSDEVVNFDDKNTVDLILLDLYMDGTSKLEALDRIRPHYSCFIVIISGEEDPAIIRDSIDHGAAGYLPKSSPEEILVPALQIVLAGGVYLPPHVLSDIDKKSEAVPVIDEENRRKLDKLTGRRLDALIKASEGKSNKVIAREMGGISEGTVKAYLAQCNEILEVHNRTAAAMAFFELLGVDNRTDAIYEIAARASAVERLKL